ncbi:hypothetical protein GCM10010990_32300 [Croceicoccus mobilis]|uniref:2-oxoacid dehydrogenase acyltransferase catalytic domain-containing protein n=1 Tax=Croceicoccus mobilis TaxID=1703339 RepID=A0A916Z735_9SPHN|nr:hypothetical protein GCM10010990_32300 [Croceicoccus mobilis]
MAASKRHIPHFSSIEEVDVTKLEEMPSDRNAARGNKPKLTILSMLITAICKILPNHPMLNAPFDDEAGIVSRFRSMPIGIATKTDAGLMLPVLRDAQSKNLWQLAAACCSSLLTATKRMFGRCAASQIASASAASFFWRFTNGFT